MINLPMYDWRSIYTTNYDTLIEQSYATKKKSFLFIDQTLISIYAKRWCYHIQTAWLN